MKSPRVHVRMRSFACVYRTWSTLPLGQHTAAQLHTLNAHNAAAAHASAPLPLAARTRALINEMLHFCPVLGQFALFVSIRYIYYCIFITAQCAQCISCVWIVLHLDVHKMKKKKNWFPLCSKLFISSLVWTMCGAMHGRQSLQPLCSVPFHKQSAIKNSESISSCACTSSSCEQHIAADRQSIV